LTVAAASHYLIHGLVVASEVDLPAPRIDARPADVTYRVVLDATLPPSSHSRTDDADDPWYVEHWMDGRLAVDFPHRATFEVSRTAVALVRDGAGDADLVIHLLLAHVLPRVVSLRGDLMLHAAGAVAPSGRAHLFLGDTGAGKSTIVTELVAGGWSLLDDDGVRVTDGVHGLRAVPGAAGVRLLPDAAAALVADVDPGLPIAHGHPKRRFAADGRRLRVAARPAPIAGVYLLERTAQRGPSLERLRFARAVSTITEHGFHLADEPAWITRQAFERASRLAAAAPVWRLSSLSGLDGLTATRALLDRLDRTNDADVHSA
jgi:hypothetical protein